jgi:hypothetical protein
MATKKIKSKATKKFPYGKRKDGTPKLKPGRKSNADRGYTY